jgi:hypothetical protein
MGNASVGHQTGRRPDVRPHELAVEVRGNAVNFPGNPRFRPRCAFKLADTSEEMESRKEMLTRHDVVITDDGPMAAQSREEVKDIILQHFGIRKHEYYIYRSHPEPFIAIFREANASDIVFAAGRVVEGPVELGFHAWDLDRFGNRQIIHYHVKLSLEGIPQHACFKQVADKVLSDEAVVHHVLRIRRDALTKECLNVGPTVKTPPEFLKWFIFLLLSTSQIQSGVPRCIL